MADEPRPPPLDPTPAAVPGARCPICRKPAAAREAAGAARSPHPFCSERCRLIDLGRWLDGAYQVPADPAAGGDTPPDQEELE